MNQQEGHNQDTLSIAALLRLAADGECNEQQEARLRAHLEAHPEDQQRIEFEHQLRGACARACSPECCAPDTLHARIRKSCCHTDPAEHLADGMAARAHQTRQTSFWAGRMVARFGAIAALIALVAVVAFMVGRTGTPGDGQSGTPGIMTASVAKQIATFVQGEHDRCAEMPALDSPKFSVHQVTDIPAQYKSLMGQSVTLASVLKADHNGLTFVDAGACSLPTGVAMHIRFKTDDPNDGFVSLWVQPDDDQMDLQEGITYTCGESCDCVRFWRAEGVRYVLVSPNVQTAPIAGQALNCPEMRTPFE